MDAEGAQQAGGAVSAPGSGVIAGSPVGASVVDARSEPAAPTIGSTAGPPSPLSSLVREGLTRLAREEGWEVRATALDVRLRGLGPGADSARGAVDPVVDRLVAETGARLERVTGGAGARFARLAAEALGGEELGGLKRSERAAQLRADLELVEGAVGALSARPAEQRLAHLARLESDLERLAGSLGAGRDGRAARARLEAVTGMVAILRRTEGSASSGG